MKSKLIFVLAPLYLFASSLNGQNNEFDTLNKYIPQLIEHFNTPGLAIAIVKDGKVQYTKGFGTKTINKNHPVDENTLFAIGSISKSFTALSLALLVDEGKLDWDDKVIDYIPYFQLYDPYVTNSFTIRDLLIHRSGLKEVSGGTLWYHSDLDREEIVRGLKYLKPASGYRDKPAYQNTMYLVASNVVEAVIDGSWDNFVRNRILKPLGMNNTVITQAERKKSANISTPHIKDKEYNVIAIEQEKLDNMAPAASFYSSSNDMAKYMNFILNDGIVGGDTLLNREVFSELIKPQNHFPMFGGGIHNEFTSYGFGWWLTPKNGNKIIDHSGGVDGMSANLIMVKNKNFGVVVLTNSAENGLIVFSLSFNIIGNFLSDDGYKMVGNYLKSYHSKSDSIKTEQRKNVEASKIQNTKPSLSLEKYAGDYCDEMYGDIIISYKKNKLQIKFSHTPLFTGELTHWHFDTFEIKWNDPRVPRGFVTFNFNANGTVSGFELDQPNLLDVDFSELKIRRKD